MLQLEDNYYDEQTGADVRAVRRLWAAKLMIHLNDYAYYLRANGGKKPAVMNENYHIGASAKRWFYDDSTKIGSFIWICDVLGFAPDRVLNGLHKNWRTIGANKSGKHRFVGTEDESEDVLS
jgi:hypothetical protein